MMATCSFSVFLWIFVHLGLPSLSTTGRVDKEVTVTHGSSVRLTCSMKPWRPATTVIWKVELKTGGKCTIGNSTTSRFVDTCQDGKTLGDTAEGVPYLHIPDFRLSDEGIYLCSAVFKDGIVELKTRVTIMENEDTTVQETHYTTSTAPQSLPTQMFCIKEMKSGT